jgi:hypothetical protein
MNIVSFRPRVALPMVWQNAELNALLAACTEAIDKGTASGWHLGRTEPGDPQLYLLGPAPDFDCILSVSRLGRLYVLEDGAGRIIMEHDAMPAVEETMRGVLGRTKAALVARVALAWVAVKETFEERIEPMLAEPMEVLTHFGPHFAALA